MPEQLQHRPAIGGAQARPRGVRLSERTGLGKIDLRGDPDDRGLRTGVGRVLDLMLPGDPCTSATTGQVSALWLAPDRWLLTCPGDDVPLFMNLLREAFGEGHHALTDVSDGRVAFRLAGPSARDVLAKGCPLDLHPRTFRPGACAGSLLGKAEVLIHLADAEPAFDLYVARSFARYLWAWLEDAGLEYGVQVAG